MVNFSIVTLTWALTMFEKMRPSEKPNQNLNAGVYELVQLDFLNPNKFLFYFLRVFLMFYGQPYAYT